MTVEQILAVVGGVGGPVVGLVAAWLLLRGTRDTNRTTLTVAEGGQELNEREQTAAETELRFEAGSRLAELIRQEVQRQVDEAMKEVRGKLDTAVRESHEMNDAVRTRETQLWLWDQKGRHGDVPMLPAPLLRKLGLGHLIPGALLEDTVPVHPIAPPNQEGTS